MGFHAGPVLATAPGAGDESFDCRLRVPTFQSYRRHPAGKLARYLDRRGHDVRALTTDIVDDRSLPLEISRERVIYTDYLERKGWLEGLTHPFRSRSASQLANRSEAAPMQGGGLRRSLRSFLRWQYHGLIHIPDMRTDWIKTALGR